MPCRAVGRTTTRPWEQVGEPLERARRGVSMRKSAASAARRLPYAFGMSLSFQVEHREGYAVVRVDGEPSLGQFLSFLQLMGVESAGFPCPRVLFDLRGVRSLTQAGEHRAVGEEVARQLPHLQRIASVVPPDRLTRASEETARQSGMDITVFTEEGEAIRWLTA